MRRLLYRTRTHSATGPSLGRRWWCRNVGFNFGAFRRCTGRLFRVEIRRLQRRRSRLIRSFCGSLFAALQPLAHPFTHVRLLTQSEGRINRRACGRTSRDSRLRMKLLQYPHAPSNPYRDQRPEIHFSEHVSQERGKGSNAGMVWRRRRQALRDDAQRYGQDETHSQQSAGNGCALHNSRESDRARGRGVGAPLAPRRTRSCAADRQPEILDGPAVIALQPGGRVPGNKFPVGRTTMTRIGEFADGK